ncbi:putative DNA-binding protein [Desulfovibrio sp. DV]|uniref:LexA family transcriptional regulator n=1 Tax=Desulfovibrio sp. DV TaxID=1844708 RepID=UPI00094B79BF|nr:S24 family peptidase [Desulfovibrio sp. DV]OLN31136.1 putative DNA-binding protein [Desulfovibrio sp. DV]
MKPDTFEDAYARIQTATRARTQTEIATILGIKQSSISDAKKKNTIPDGWLVTLYRAFALEPDWILYGQMPASRREGAALPAGVRESAGGYASPPSRVTVYAMARTDPERGCWIREGQETIPLLESLNRPNLLVVKMDNTSMEPVIRRNAYVGLDCDDTRLRSGEIYALDVPGEGLVVKRVIRDLEKQRLAMLAENPAHQGLYLPLDNPGVTTVGKAVWVIQEL